MADDGAYKPSPRNKKPSSQPLGPKSLFLRRSAGINGFGFTLRHFIVYPPESYMVLARDRRLGLRCRSIDEPLDTIFIKHVRPDTPASAAGLVPGDRIVSVNGQTITDLQYADIVQLIQQTPNYLHLLVVPKENDLLQLYFSETAHNPETNQRPPCPIYQNVWEVEQDQIYARRASEGSNCDNFAPPINNIPRCRLSLDAGLSDSASTMRDSHSSDDSVIITRIRKSCEQKEEFLKRAVINTPPKEFYSRAQKLQESPWPPSQKNESSWDSATSKGNKNKQSFITSLSRIQENSKVPSQQAPPVPPHQSLHPSQQKISSNSPQQQHPSNFQIVSTRTRQFESGEVDHDKTEFHRSELSRLTNKQNVPNVAVRKQEFEALSCQSNSSNSTSQSVSNTNSLTSPSSSFNSVSSSGNRIIPVGNNNLHCEPPTCFVSPDEDPEMFDDIGSSYPSRNKVVRQDSYLAACKKPVLATQLKDEPVVRTRPRPSQLTLSPNSNARPAKMRDSQIPDDYLDQVPDIHIEELKTPSEKSANDSTDEEKAARRLSYMKANWSNHSDLELSDNERSPSSRRKSSCLKDVTREGYLQVKVTLVDGKKASDRSWKQFYAVLVGTTLYLFKERKDFLPSDETPASLDKLEMSASCERIDIRHNCVEVACDYTKRKHVLRLTSPASNTELLLQADDTLTMAHWIRDFQHHAGTIAQSASESNISPSAPHKSLRKMTSPRKSSATDATLPPSPKTKTWKDRVADKLRKIQPGGGSPNSPHPPYPPGSNIGVPLQHCIPSTFSEFVPLLVELCTNVVESKGLDIIGIYRVPGNTAAVTSLTEAVNKGLDPSVLAQDPRWSDVNTISSLLKSFFRRLPDSLLTTELYPQFIQADKIENPLKRIAAVKKLVHELPEYHFQTLKYIMEHLKRVADNAEVNKMEARNLSIVFGPTLVRAGDDNMVTMITDMSHQYRIVETLILNVEWCFGESDNLDPDVETLTDIADLEHNCGNQSLLLNNIQKMEGIQHPKDLVSSILFAANRKIYRSVSSTKAFGQTHPSPLTMSASTSKIAPIAATPSPASTPTSTSTSSGDQQTSSTSALVKIMASPHSPVAQSISQSVLFSGKIAKTLQGEEEQDGGPITSYTGLSATTQERIRRFEQETMAMLQKDYKLNTKDEREKLQREFQTKRELEPDNKSMDSLTQSSSELRPSESSSASSYSCSHSNNNISSSTPTSSPTRSPRSPRIPSRSRSTTQMKRFKTGKEIENESSPNSGSSDSLTLQDVNRSQQLLPSDEGSDLLTTITSTFDQKLKLLLESERESVRSSQEESGESFKDPSLHRNLDISSNKSSDSESRDKENQTVSNVKENKDKCEDSKPLTNNNTLCSINNNNNNHKTLRLTLSEMNPSECKLNRSSSLRKHEDNERKLKRTGSLNVRPSRSDSKIESRSKFEALVQNFENKNGISKRNDSLTKNEKTDINKRRQSDIKSKWGREKENMVKLKRKNGVNNARSIKRRHTVGGTKDFDKVNWLQREREALEESKKERRTSSPDLSYSRLQNILSDVVMRPKSLLDTHFSSRLLESHV